MYSARHADAVVFWAPAKVNLFLEVLARRPDGYHDIATLMVAVTLSDRLEFRAERSGQTVLQCDLPTLTTGPDNLICRAAELLRRKTGRNDGANIRLTKQIPLAAGLAGGSTDAAATLAGLNELWSLGLTRAELSDLGAELGSDVPFFFSTPAAWCTGRGEQVTPLRLDPPLSFVLVSSPTGLSTAEVYRNVTVPAQPLSGEEIRRAVETGDIEEIGRRLHNRLQPPAERLCPQVAEIHRRLQQLQPAGCLMSGSGSTVFALCRDDNEAQRIAHEMEGGAKGEGRPRVHVVRSSA